MWIIVIVAILVLGLGAYYYQHKQKITLSTPSSYLVPGKVPDGYKLTSTIPLNGYDSEYNYSLGKSSIQFREVAGYKSFDDYVKSWTRSNGTVIKEFTYNGNRGVVVAYDFPAGNHLYELGYQNDIFIERILSDNSITPDALIDILKGMEVKKLQN